MGFSGLVGKIGGLLGGTNRFEVMKKRSQKMINLHQDYYVFNRESL